MAPMSCAPAQTHLLLGTSSLTGLDWLMSLSWPMFLLVLAGYITAGAVTILPVLNTFTDMGAWEMQAVGGGTRGEPLVATLLSYACFLYLSLMSNEWQMDDSVWINGIGMLAFLVYLLLFLYCAGDAHCRTTRRVCVPVALLYLSFTMGVGFVMESTEAVQWLCTLASLAATCIPLALAIFVMDRYVENLPDCMSSSVGLLYSAVWFGLGLVPERDYHAMGQNAAGAICSIAFLALLTRWPSNPAAPLRVPLLQRHDHVIDVPPLLANDPPVVLQGVDNQQAPQGANPPLVLQLQGDNQQAPQGGNPPLVLQLQGDNQQAPQGANPPLVLQLQGDNQQAPQGANPPLVGNPLPAVVDPDVVDPAVADPEVVDPDVVDPAVADPEVVDPDIADPELPDVANPEVVGPAIVAAHQGAIPPAADI